MNNIKISLNCEDTLDTKLERYLQVRISTSIYFLTFSDRNLSQMNFNFIFSCILYLLNISPRKNGSVNDLDSMLRMPYGVHNYSSIKNTIGELVCRGIGFVLNFLLITPSHQLPYDVNRIHEFLWIGSNGINKYDWDYGIPKYTDREISLIPNFD